MPEKLNIFVSPEKNVLFTPQPKIGKIRSGIKFFIDETSIIIILIKIIGKINKLALAITFKETANNKKQSYKQYRTSSKVYNS